MADTPDPDAARAIAGRATRCTHALGLDAHQRECDETTKHITAALRAARAEEAERWKSSIRETTWAKEIITDERTACVQAIRAACSMCNGAGVESSRPDRRVTHEMALDAGEPEMEGMTIPGDATECEYCGRPIAAIRARGQQGDADV